MGVVRTDCLLRFSFIQSLFVLVTLDIIILVLLRRDEMYVVARSEMMLDDLVMLLLQDAQRLLRRNPVNAYLLLALPHLRVLLESGLGLRRSLEHLVFLLLEILLEFLRNIFVCLL